jgi:hypothetical protein
MADREAKEINLQDQSVGKGSERGSGVVTQRHLLAFGAYVLIVLALLMTLSCATYFFADKDHLQSGKEIFELAKVTLPPIATLILGFYFRGNHGTE